jgi:hypothetical protein
MRRKTDRAKKESRLRQWWNSKWANWIKMIVQCILAPRFLLCFGIAWMITNGWSYVLFALGTFLDIGWMVAVGGAYLAFLWLPISPEKIVTVAIAMVLLRWLFPNDEKTLGILKKLHADVMGKRKEKQEKKKTKKKDSAG